MPDEGGLDTRLDEPSGRAWTFKDWVVAIIAIAFLMTLMVLAAIQPARADAIDRVRGREIRTQFVYCARFDEAKDVLKAFENLGVDGQIYTLLTKTCDIAQGERALVGRTLQTISHAEDGKFWLTVSIVKFVEPDGKILGKKLYVIVLECQIATEPHQRPRRPPKRRAPRICVMWLWVDFLFLLYPERERHAHLFWIKE